MFRKILKQCIIDLLMEEVEFENSDGIKLAGFLHLPDVKTKDVVIMCHGLMSNKDRPRLIEMGQEFAAKDIAFLRFDFSGCGQSEDALISGENQVKDIRAAVKFVQGKGFIDIGLIGESFGGYCAIKAWTKEVKSLVLWAPVTNKLVHHLWKEQRELIEKKGYIEREKNGRGHKLSKQLFLDLESIDQDTLLRRIKIPVLIIHGDIRDNADLVEHYLAKGRELL